MNFSAVLLWFRVHIGVIAIFLQRMSIVLMSPSAVFCRAAKMTLKISVCLCSGVNIRAVCKASRMS